MKHRSLFLFALTLCMTVLLVLPVFANSAEPPCLTIVVVDAPEDLELSLVDADGAETVQLEKLRSSRGWETYYRYFYNHDFRFGEDVELTELRLAVTTGGETAYLAMPALAYEHYNNVVMLDLDAMALQRELYPGRMTLIIGLRVVLTLLIEGILFWVFGYREKHSWGVFLGFNAMTQLVLNLLLGGATMDSYVLFGYYLLEAGIVIFEALAYWNTLREKRGRSIPYALCANLASMYLGGLMISNLPLAL